MVPTNTKTTIEDGAFVGSDTQLIAPVTIGKNATIGAGSTITKDVPDNQLSLSRSKQTTLKNWQRPTKNKLNAGLIISAHFYKQLSLQSLCLSLIKVHF